MIAISYRRQDSSPVAGRLYDRLQAEFGKGNVFMDFDSIPYGVDFREHIKQTVRRAKVVVAIIGPEWTGGNDLAGRRIDDPTDFVRLEVASALENGIPIIPVLINNTAMPKKLPPELEGLAFRNGLALDTGIDFHHHADRLIAGIHKVIDPAKETPPLPSGTQPEPLPTTNPPAQKKSSLVPIAVIAGLVAITGIAAWFFVGRSPQRSVVVSTPPTPRQSVAPAPTAAIVTQASVAPVPPQTPQVTQSAHPESNPEEVGREHTYTGKVGAKEATFRLRFEPSGHVTGTYTQGSSTYRLEGRHPRNKLLLDEYTAEQVTAHIELNKRDTATAVRWEGTMHNTPPDNRVFPVYFERLPPSMQSAAPTP